jgi:sec-independent protein translocase protein TatB
VLGVNSWELVVIAVVALVVLGPEGLLEALVAVGRVYRRLRVLSDELTAEVRRQLEPVESVEHGGADDDANGATPSR